MQATPGNFSIMNTALSALYTRARQFCNNKTSDVEIKILRSLSVSPWYFASMSIGAQCFRMNMKCLERHGTAAFCFSRNWYFLETQSTSATSCYIGKLHKRLNRMRCWRPVWLQHASPMESAKAPLPIKDSPPASTEFSVVAEGGGKFGLGLLKSKLYS